MPTSSSTRRVCATVRMVLEILSFKTPTASVYMCARMCVCVLDSEWEWNITNILAKDRHEVVETKASRMTSEAHVLTSSPLTNVHREAGFNAR